MSRTTLVTLFAFTAPVALALAGEAAGKPDSCPVAEKVSSLLASWKAASEEAKALSSAEKEKLETRLTALAKECPIGARVGPTFAAVKDVLASAASSQEACEKACPLVAAEKRGDKSEACAEGLKLKTARSKIIRDLHQLASYAAGSSGGSACCAAEGAVKTAALSPAKAEGSASSAACSKELLARVTALKVSWDKAAPEAKALPEAKQKEILAGFGALAQTSKAVVLIPPSLLALADGLDALESVHGKMAEWGRSNPQFLASVPEEGKKAFESQMALFRETREVLVRAREAMKASGACGSPEACPEKTRTAAAPAR